MPAVKMKASQEFGFKGIGNSYAAKIAKEIIKLNIDDIDVILDAVIEYLNMADGNCDCEDDCPLEENGDEQDYSYHEYAVAIINPENTLKCANFT